MRMKMIEEKARKVKHRLEEEKQASGEREIEQRD